MSNRYERSRLSRPFTYKGIQYHPAMLAVLAAQCVCLAVFSFAGTLLDNDKWLAAMLGFSLLFGLILTLGFFGTWSQFRDDIDLRTFFDTNPVELAIAVATAGEVIAILMIAPVS
jgi:hypothetical protein